MFEPNLIADAYAASAAPMPVGSDLQQTMYVVGVIVGSIVAGIAAVLYRKSPNGQGPTPTVSVDVLGPYQVIFDRLGTIMLALERVAGGHIETREATAKALQTTRHDLKAVLHEMSQQNESDMEEIKRLIEAEMKEVKQMVREKTAVSSRLDEFVRAKLK